MPPRLFLSYAREDDEPFAKRLEADLREAGFDVWWDRVSLASRRLSFHQEIKDAIRERDRVIYIAGPKAAVSNYVREEWKFALECDKWVVPILRKGDFDVVPGELCLLHCDDFRDDAQYPDRFAKLIANLKRDEPPLGKLFAVPNLPKHFLGRPDILRRLKDAVRIDLQRPVVITSATSRVGLQGMGGIGKSVLAAAVARDREIRRSYPDGVIWVSFGQIAPDDAERIITELMRDVAHHLGDPGLFQNIAQGQGVLRDLLLTKAVLLVLDDVWRAADAQPFDVLGPRCRALVTTRDAGILRTLHGEIHPVELFNEGEALSLLAAAVEKAPAELPPEAHEVVKECDGLALALALCGGMASKRDGDWGNILERLRRADLAKIADREAIDPKHQSIYRAMQVSVEALAPEEQRRFAELSVFVTDQDVPEPAIATLWAETGNLDALDTEDLLINLSERALIRLERRDSKDGGTPVRWMSLHDLLYDFARRSAGDRQALEQTLVTAYRRKCTAGWHTGPADGYFFRNLCHHLASASGSWDETAELLCDLRFVDARCRVGEVFELRADYQLALDNLPEAQPLVEERRKQRERATRWIGEITAYARAWSERRDRAAQGLALDPVEPRLPEAPESCRMWTDEEIAAESRRILENPTRLDRLAAFAGFVGAECYPLLQFGLREGFVAQHASNHAPGGPVHTAAAAILPECRSVVMLRRSPPDAALNPRPALLSTLEGHSDEVSSVSVTPDGRRIVSASLDGTLRVWDLESGQCLRTLEGHSDEVSSVSVTPDGRRAISGSSDESLRVWDLESGQCLRTLEGHSDEVSSVSVTPDGRRAVSASSDKTVRVWDLDSGECLRALEGHPLEVTSVMVTPDGRRAVSADQRLRAGRAHETLRVWDLEIGTCLDTLEGRFVSITLDGRCAFSSDIHEGLRIWDLENGACLHALEGHEAHVDNVSLTLDRRHAISGSRDKTLRVWDLNNGQCLRTLESHSGAVSAVSMTADGGRAVSGSEDKTVCVWDVERGSTPRTLEGHSDEISCVSMTPDGRRAVSGSYDNTVRIWDVESGACLRTLECGNCVVWGVTVTLDGARIVSTGDDGTLRVWDVDSGACLRECTGQGNEYWVHSVGVTPDSRHAVLPGNDETLRILDLDNGQLRTLHCETSGIGYWVWGVSVTPDGRRAVMGSDRATLRVWDLGTGACVRILEGHRGAVSSVIVTRDGRCAVSGSEDMTLRVWDLESGACLRILEGHHGAVSSVALMSDSRYVVSASADKTARVWDLERGECRGLCAASSAINSIALARRGDIVCAGTARGEMIFLDVRNTESGANGGPKRLEISR